MRLGVKEADRELRTEKKEANAGSERPSLSMR